MSCEICPIIETPSDDERRARLLEGKNWIATLRLNDQTLLGTSFITARRHVESLGHLTQEEQLEFFDIHAQLERAIKQAFGAAVINTSCLTNHAFRSNPAEPHIHWHLKPRYQQTVNFAGQTFTDPGFGSYLDGNYPRVHADQSTATAITNEIRMSL